MRSRSALAAIALGPVIVLLLPAAGLAQARGGGSGHATAARAGGTATPTTQTGSSSAARPREGQPTVGTAAPRSTVGPVQNAATRPTTSIFNVPNTYYSVPPTFYTARPFSPLYRGRIGAGVINNGSYWSNFGYGGGYMYAPPAYDETLATSDVVLSPPIPEMPDVVVPDQPQAAAAGNLRLVVDPPTAQIFVDGYFVGSVDDYADTLAGLLIEAGLHHLEFRAAGYETLAVDIKIDAHRTITFRGSLKPV